MNWVSNIVVFSIIWWTILFMVLPWGVSIDPNPEKGMATSAPTHARIGLKLLVTTLISTLLWLITKYVIEYELISLF